MYFRNYAFEKRRLDKYLKSAASQYSSTSNIVKMFKHISNHHGSTLIFDNDIEFEKVTVCDIQNVMTLC